MADEINSGGAIITFYSYKGGAGRSMAVANIGRLLARDHIDPGQNTLLIDWDLDAPGLEQYFPRRDSANAGLIEYFTALVRLLRAGFGPKMRDEPFPRELERELPLDDYITSSGVPGVQLMTAGGSSGIREGMYQKLVSSFNWIELFHLYPIAIQAFCSLLKSRFAYVLIDSRTGISDISGFCTSLLPEKLVAMFGPNRQNKAILPVIEAALEFRRMSDDLRPLVVFPLASRFDSAEL